jgi:hypothetical protein
MAAWGATFGLLIVLGAGASHAHADEKRPAAFGSHYGYVSDVEEERNKRDIELVLPDNPPPRKTLSEALFNPKLTKDFQSEYEYRFGRSQAEQLLNSPGQQDEYIYYTGHTVTIQEYQSAQRAFATYMGRKLFEYHVDNWAKNDPDLRPAYQLKDRVSNLNVKVKSGYKVNWKYNFAGPNMEVKVENPYDIEAKAHIDMNGLLSPNEEIYSLGYPINPRTRVTGIYKRVDGLYQLIFTRQLTKRISSSLTGSVDTRDEGPTIRQNLLLVGLSWSD